MTLERVWLPSPNYSSGRGSTRLLIVHTAEGATTYQSLGSYFSSSSVQVSSQVGIDDTYNVIGEYVRNTDRSWAAASFNGIAVQAELCAFASWKASDWAAHETMLVNTAAWLAEEAATFGIPLVKLTAEQAQGSSRGVCGHNELGSAGGGHWDPGPDFPWDHVLAMATGSSSSTPAKRKGTHMWTLRDETSGGTWVADETGAVWSYDGAPYLGGVNNPTYNAAGWPCAGLAGYVDDRGDGYLLTLDTGDSDGPGDRFTRYRFPRDGSAVVKA